MDNAVTVIATLCCNLKPMTLRVARYFSSEHAIAALPYGSANGNNSKHGFAIPIAALPTDLVRYR